MQHLHTIRDEDKIFSATGEGKVPFVSVDDIAEAAFRALTDDVSHNTDHLILGPELFSHDDVSSPHIVNALPAFANVRFRQLKS